jgi:alkylation response protein AidB-like acyl-CoA dehydrogenase
MATERGWDPATWTQMATELGWAAMAIPEAYGGAGAGAEELGAVFEEMGRHVACAPLFSTVCLGAGAILACGDDEQRARFLAPIVERAETATLAITERGAAWDASDVTTVAARAEGGWSLRGVKRYVVDGSAADHVVVVAREEGSSGAEGIGLFVVPGAARGLERRAVGTMDQTRRLAELTLRDVRVPSSDRLVQSDWAAVERVLHRACAALAAEQVGGASRCLEMSVDYAKVRTQFGRPIGSFQAIKHMLADMYVSATLARSNGYYGAWALSTGAAELPEAAATARVSATQAFQHCAKNNIQVHGGMGFTWEVPAHLAYKRARVLATQFGTDDQLAEALGDSLAAAGTNVR